MSTIADKDRGSTSGFTLLEVMVATGVLAIALTALLTSQSRTMLVAGNNDFLHVSAQLTARHMSEFLAGDGSSTVRSASFGSPHEDYFWRLELGQPFDGVDTLPEGVAGYLQRIDLEVGDVRRDQRAAITRYRFDPARQ